MHGETLLPSVLEQGKIDIFIVLEGVKFVIFFHKCLSFLVWQAREWIIHIP